MATVKASTESGQAVAAYLQGQRKAALEKCTSMMANTTLTADQVIRHYNLFVSYRGQFMNYSGHVAARAYVNSIEALLDPESYPFNANRAVVEGVEPWNYIAVTSGVLDMHDVRVVSYEFIVACTAVIDALLAIDVSIATSQPTTAGAMHQYLEFPTAPLGVAAQGLYNVIEV